MVVQYPHSIKVFIHGVTSEDEDGNVSAGEPTVFTSACRAENNTEAKVIRGEDGSEIAYSFDVFMPKTDANLGYNSEIEIRFDATKVVRGRLKGLYNGQLNSRVWV